MTFKKIKKLEFEEERLRFLISSNLKYTIRKSQQHKIVIVNREKLS